MNSNSRKNTRRNVPRRVDVNDESLWDEPYKKNKDLARDLEEMDTIARRNRLRLPLKLRMNVWWIHPRRLPMPA